MVLGHTAYPTFWALRSHLSLHDFPSSLIANAPLQAANLYKTMLNATLKSIGEISPPFFFFFPRDFPPFPDFISPFFSLLIFGRINYDMQPGEDNTG